MLTLNKNSWHYRIVSFCESSYNIPDQLCPYVRKLIFKTIFFSMTIAIIFGGAGTMWFTLLGKIPSIEVITYSVILGVISPFVFFATSYAIFMSGSWICGWVIKKNTDHSLRKQSERIEKGLPLEKEPGIFSTWATSVHDKMCPTLKFTVKDK